MSSVKSPSQQMPMSGEPLPEDHLQEPADYDSWYSALVSFVFHFCLVMILPLLATVLAPAENMPPAIEVVQVVDNSDATGNLNEELAAPEGAEMTDQQAEVEDLLQETPQETLSEIAKAESEEETLTDEELLESTSAAVSESKKAAASAKAAAAKMLDGNLGGGGGSGGEGGGRAGRAARWVLIYNTNDVGDYLRQMGGLGADIAFPASGGQYTFFTNLSTSPTNAGTKSLANESRMYWFDDDPTSVRRVTSHLNTSSASIMVVFLPRELEQRMVKLELAYGNVTSEDQIAQTTFVCIRSGGRYDVRVKSQVKR